MGFRETVEEKVRELRSALQSAEKDIAFLQKERERMELELEHLQGWLSVQEEPPTEPSILDLIEKVLRRWRKPARLNEILELLRQVEGFEMPGKDPLRNLSAHLSGNPRRFKNVERGVWTLAGTAEGQNGDYPPTKESQAATPPMSDDDIPF